MEIQLVGGGGGGMAPSLGCRGVQGFGVLGFRVSRFQAIWGSRVSSAPAEKRYCWVALTH